MQDKNSKLVFSTDQSISRKEKPVEKDVVSNPGAVRQNVSVQLERKGRGGKMVTIILGLRMPAKEREALLKRLKSGLGTGGTVKDASIEIQGDHRDALITTLEKMGYKAKRSGG